MIEYIIGFVCGAGGVYFFTRNAIEKAFHEGAFRVMLSAVHDKIVFCNMEDPRGIVLDKMARSVMGSKDNGDD